VLAAATGAGAAALLSLSGCRSAVSVAAGSEAAGSGPVRGGTLSVGVAGDFSPSLLFTVSSNPLVPGLIYNTLTRYDDRLRPQPELATSWRVSPDGRTVTLHLRRGVRFHTGRPFTADDVVFAIENVQNPVRSAQLRSTALAVSGFRKQGDHTLVLSLAHPVGNLFDLFEFMFIPDRETLADALAGRRLVGTGPFVFDSWQPGSAFTVKANSRYWQAGRPYLDEVRLRVVTDTTTALSALRSGQTQLTYSLPGRQAAPLAEDSRYRLHEYRQGAGNLYLGINTTVPPLDDRTVRQALAWAVDRKRVLSQVLGGYGLATAAPWPASSPAYTAASAAHYTHDPARARRLLRSAGVGGLRLPLLTSTLTGTLAELVQYDLAQVGVRTTIQTVDPVTLQKNLIDQGMPALWVTSHGFAQVQPSTLAVSAYPFNQARNTSRYHSAAYTDAVLAAWRRPPGGQATAADRAAYRRITDLLLDEAFIVELAVQPSLQVSTANLRGVTVNKFGYLDASGAYLSA
jgi:peptide/nickel transport system substrate-binding protein